MSDVALLIVIAGGVGAGLITAWRHNRSDAKAPCSHCWHWLFTTRMGSTIHRHCCRCGRAHSTYIVGRDAMTTLRTGEHGQYVEYKSEQDRGKGVT